MLALFVYEAGSWEVDSDRRELRAHGRPIVIGPRAFDIIEKLAESAGTVVSKADLEAHVWQGAVVGENTLRVHIHAIRKALGPDRTLLTNYAGRGYRLIGRWTTIQDDERAEAAPRRRAPEPKLSVANGLPDSTSELIGRTSEMARLRDLVSAFRVVTLTGPGGIGKTALALALARSLAHEFDGGIGLVELASLSNPDLLPSTVIAALGLNANAKGNSADDVAGIIGRTKLLVVLDNCEHMIAAVADFAETILRRCPNTSLLVTSREVMKIAGEHVFHVPPLAVPEASHGEDEALASSAVELFAARTRALNGRFRLNSATLPAVVSICRRLDGIPLAIEFAAARAATFGPQWVLAGLDDRFRLLTGHRRTAVPRHRTLRATLDWSHELLSATERAFLRRLAVFAGPFDLKDATEIAAMENSVELLSDAVDKSLVVTEHRESITVYRLLDTTRVYLQEKLAGSEELEAVTRRHAAHYLDLFERIESEWQARPADELRAAHAWRADNVRAALEWAFSAEGDILTGIALTTATIPLWMHLSSLDECRRRVEQALDRLPAAGTVDARREMKLHAAFGASAFGASAATGLRAKAKASWKRALQLARTIGDVDHQLRALLGLWVLEYVNPMALAEQFCAIAVTPMDRLVGKRMIGVTNHYLGNLAESRRYLEQAVADASAEYASAGIIRFQIDQRPAAMTFLARILWLQGYPEQAMRAAKRAVEQAEASGHGLSLCHALAIAACPVALWSGDLDLAQHYVELLRYHTTKNALSLWEAWSRCHQGMLAIQRGNISDGADLIRTGFDDLSVGSQGFRVLVFQGVLAAAMGRFGRVDEGMAVIAKAFDRAERTGERWVNPELRRINGELLLQKHLAGGERKAEACFREALEEARGQGARSWELRAAESLARLLRDQGRPSEAMEVLRPVYDQFLEGLNTADLKSARALLGSLR
ncbi:MAG: winged helix-turn-helix domain-containing protein [Alphaproteobacteria bacterium]|nr:winged helix-turn-helix domain-containing protein [Alphaproteobacteria bacterium]